jgi:hypothetical protein
MKSNFVDDCFNDISVIDKIDDYVEKWHLGDGNDKSLYEYLGLTRREYFQWVMYPDSLNLTIESKKIINGK